MSPRLPKMESGSMMPGGVKSHSGSSQDSTVSCRSQEPKRGLLRGARSVRTRTPTSCKKVDVNSSKSDVTTFGVYNKSRKISEALGSGRMTERTSVTVQERNKKENMLEACSVSTDESDHDDMISCEDPGRSLPIQEAMAKDPREEPIIDLNKMFKKSEFTNPHKKGLSKSFFSWLGRVFSRRKRDVITHPTVGTTHPTIGTTHPTVGNPPPNQLVFKSDAELYPGLDNSDEQRFLLEGIRLYGMGFYNDENSNATGDRRNETASHDGKRVASVNTELTESSLAAS